MKRDHYILLLPESRTSCFFLNLDGSPEDMAICRLRLGMILRIPRSVKVLVIQYKSITLRNQNVVGSKVRAKILVNFIIRWSKAACAGFLA